MNKNFLRWYLKEFYISKINIQIYNDAKNYSIFDNIIIDCLPNHEQIKFIVSSLILQENSMVEFFSVQLYKILELQFTTDSDDRLIMSDLINPKILIIKELGDVNNKLYKDFYQSIIIERIMKEKNSILIFTTKKYSDFIDRSMLQNFKIINLKNKYIDVKQDNPGIMRVPTVNDLY